MPYFPRLKSLPYFPGAKMTRYLLSRFTFLNVYVFFKMAKTVMNGKTTGKDWPIRWKSGKICVFFMGRFIIYPAYPVGCIFFEFSKMFRAPFGGTAICFVPLHGQSKIVSYPLFKKSLEIPRIWPKMFRTPFTIMTQ